jgi:protein-disulfide isomerase
MPHATRRTLLGASLASAFVGVAAAQTSDHMTIGAADAPLHLTEFASLTCPHCAHFHETNWSTLKTRYIDTGRVRFTLHEMLTPPPGVALGMFQVARCNNASAQEYMRRVAILFERQAAIMSTGTLAGVRDALLAAGAEWGLSQEQVMASLSDPAGADRARRSLASADAAGITATPSFQFNGVRETDTAFLTPQGMVRILDARLAAL